MNRYYGVYDYDYSLNWRPNEDDRIHWNYPFSKTICARTNSPGVIVSGGGCSYLRIRKLTPRECFRLMGVKDEDFNKIAKNQSDSSLYHLAGDSIVVNVLMAIFKEII